MKCLKFLSAFVCAFFIYLPGSYAAPVAIDSLFVDYASVSLKFDKFSLFNFSRSFEPVEITMGEFQDPIISQTFGFKYLDIYTTGAYGAAAPSGYVDGTTINVDLSSLRVDFGINGIGSLYDGGLWPLNTPNDAGRYNPVTGEYKLAWAYGFKFNKPGMKDDYYGSLVVKLSGHATTSVVPVPAAAWLFGSGLLALAGLMRGKNNLHVG